MQQMADRNRMQTRRLGHAFVAVIFALTVICQQQNTGAGQSAGGGGAGAGQLGQFGALRVGQGNGHSFIHSFAHTLILLREALERFPELHREIADADSVGWVWFELWYGLFKPAYEKEPPDSEMIARMYDYAYWCLDHHNVDVRTAAILDFYEMLSSDNRMWRDMPRWISPEDFDMLHFAWEYSTKRDFADLRREFIANKARIDTENRNRRPKSASGKRLKG